MSDALSITELHAGIKTTLRAAFPTTGSNAVPVIDYYTRPTEKFATPAIFFELTDIGNAAESDDIGTEQLQVTLSFSAYVCVSYRATAAKIALRELVVALMGEVWDNHFGCKVKGAENVTASPDQFSVEPGGTGNGAMQQYEVWRVDWTHDALIGTSIWDTAPEIIPDKVFLGYDPNVGLAHEAEYDQVIPEGSDE